MNLAAPFCAWPNVPLHDCPPQLVTALPLQTVALHRAQATSVALGLTPRGKAPQTLRVLRLRRPDTHKHATQLPPQPPGISIGVSLVGLSVSMEATWCVSDGTAGAAPGSGVLANAIGNSAAAQAGGPSVVREEGQGQGQGTGLPPQQQPRPGATAAAGTPVPAMGHALLSAGPGAAAEPSVFYRYLYCHNTKYKTERQCGWTCPLCQPALRCKDYAVGGVPAGTMPPGWGLKGGRHVSIHSGAGGEGGRFQASQEDRCRQPHRQRAREETVAPFQSKLLRGPRGLRIEVCKQNVRVARVQHGWRVYMQLTRWGEVTWLLPVLECASDATADRATPKGVANPLPSPLPRIALLITCSFGCCVPRRPCTVLRCRDCNGTCWPATTSSGSPSRRSTQQQPHQRTQVQG